MCGIIGCIGDDSETVEVLLSGLGNLEYRGYDSAGIALANQELEVVKREGDLDHLRAAIDDFQSGTAPVGLGHTRWSTHGPPTQANAHPHTDCSGQIAVVHNGIIENYSQLRTELEESGHEFTSDTDTEVIPHLIESALANTDDFQTAFRKTVEQLEGSYALAAVCAGSNHLVATRQDSPLVIGIAEDAYYLGSDVPAFLEYTDRVVYLEDGDTAVLSPTNWRVVDAGGDERSVSVEHVEWEPEETGKGGYAHYMRKEINEQPRALRQCLQGRVDELTDSINLDDLNSLRGVESVHFVGCGTSYHASVYAASLFRMHGIPAQAFLASEYASSPPPDPIGTLVVGITQSGETADTLSALREASGRGVRTLAVTNVVGSTAARECDDVVFIRAGPEIGVAATKTFSSQVVTANLLLHHLLETTNRDHEGVDGIAALRDLPGQVQAVLDNSTAAEIAEIYQNATAYFFIGRGLQYPVALEGALKLKEITYKHAEGFAAGELKHGPLALVTEDTPVFATITGTNERAQKTLGNVKEVETRGAPVVAVTDGRLEVDRVADMTLSIPETSERLAPVLANIQYQLVAYHIAANLGRSIDKPRHLAKSVTVE